MGLPVRTSVSSSRINGLTLAIQRLQLYPLCTQKSVNSNNNMTSGQRILTKGRIVCCALYYRLAEPILEILHGTKMVFTSSAMTPPKVNRFGSNLEQCEPNVGAGAGRFWARSMQ